MLEESGEAENLRRAHAEFFARLAEEAEPHLVGPDQKLWLVRLEKEQSNVREVLDWSSRHDPQLQLSLVAAVWRLWYVRAYIAEGLQWLRRAVEAPHDEVTPALAKALRALAIFFDEGGDYVHAEEAAKRISAP
jgi:predicted ATPase